MRRWITELQDATTYFFSDQQSSSRTGHAKAQRCSQLKRDSQIAMLNLWPRLSMACIDRTWVAKEILKLGLHLAIFYQISDYLHQSFNP